MKVEISIQSLKALMKVLIKKIEAQESKLCTRRGMNHYLSRFPRTMKEVQLMVTTKLDLEFSLFERNERFKKVIC